MRARLHAASWQEPWVAAVGVLAVVAAVVVVVLGDRLSFFNDDWYFLLQRPGLDSGAGLDSLLAPHNSNLVALSAAVYKAMVLVFGLSSQIPYRMVLGAMIAGLGILIYLLVSARAGKVLGVAAAAVALFLGPAWEDLLFFASIDLIGSLVMGLGGLLALERDSPRRNAIACLMLIGAVGFSNLGIAFVVAAVVCVLVRRSPKQLWVPAVPLVLFATWWVSDGSAQPSHLSTTNLEHLPRYLFDSAASGLASMTGFSYARGKVLLVAAVFAAGVWFVRGGRPRVWVLVPLSAALSFWILTGASFVPGREPFASRYQLIDVTLLTLIGAELLRPLRMTAARSLVVLVIAATVVTSNITGGLSYGYDLLHLQSGYVKADLGALTVVRQIAPPGLRLTPAVARNAYLSGITVGRYFGRLAPTGPAPSIRSTSFARPLPRNASRLMASWQQPSTLSPAPA